MANETGHALSPVNASSCVAGAEPPWPALGARPMRRTNTDDLAFAAYYDHCWASTLQPAFGVSSQAAVQGCRDPHW